MKRNRRAEPGRGMDELDNLPPARPRAPRGPRRRRVRADSEHDGEDETNSSSSSSTSRRDSSSQGLGGGSAAGGGDGGGAAGGSGGAAASSGGAQGADGDDPGAPVGDVPVAPADGVRFGRIRGRGVPWPTVGEAVGLWRLTQKTPATGTAGWEMKCFCHDGCKKTKVETGNTVRLLKRWALAAILSDNPPDNAQDHFDLWAGIEASPDAQPTENALDDLAALIHLPAGFIAYGNAIT